jgi:integrase
VKDLDFIDFLIDSKGLSQQSAACYERLVRSVWPQDPSGWTQKYLRGRPPGTACAVKAAVRHWIEFTGRDPKKFNLKGGRIRSHRPAPRGLSSAQLRAYLHGAESKSEPVRTILLLLPRTGLRISELCSARKHQLERREKRIALVVVGKRDHERRVYLSKEAEKILDRYLKSEDPKGDFLFPGYGNKGISPSRVRQVSAELGGDLGFRVNPHTLRHTFASTLHTQGVRLPVLKEAMGHSSERTTMQYIHPSDRELIEAADLSELKGTL